ncbi:hypothetical protein [Pedobacter gandavensis]|uniref:hypothetical protein n=1 Tax=Pedobacter gandavensis TaxID=2679963 RepID=UPI0029303E33|nr:hypothetical protein [Pedobacter gandavensis]
MKYKIILIFLFFSIDLRAQYLCRTDIMNKEELIPVDKTQYFRSYNFSNLWLKTDNRLVYGIIGDEHQRILIKILTVVKNPDNANEYLVKGKSSVKENVCDFNGKITIKEIKESRRTRFGLDNEFKDKGIKTQGLLTAKYEFFEDKSQKHVGAFYGVVKTKWYVNKENEITYDDMNIESDGYFNNAFVGIWKRYGAKIEKKCNWGDYRVPASNCDFDIGTAEFNVAQKYCKYGWLDVALSHMAPNFSIIESGKKEILKQWWL